MASNKDRRPDNNRSGLAKQAWQNNLNLAKNLLKYLDGDAMGAFLTSLWKDGIDPVTKQVVEVPIRLTALRLHLDRALGAVPQSVVLQGDLEVKHDSRVGVDITGMTAATRASLREILRKGLNATTTTSDDMTSSLATVDVESRELVEKENDPDQ